MSSDVSTNVLGRANVSQHSIALLKAVLVAFLWASSYVLIELGLRDIPTLPFAGLRYVIALLFLVPLFAKKYSVDLLREFDKRDWVNLACLGLLWYAITPVSHFFSQLILPASTVGLLLGFTPFVVATMSSATLDEELTSVQKVGIAVFIVGVVVYFGPTGFPYREVLGIGAAMVAVIANAGSTVFGRHINNHSRIPSVVVTVVSMAFGGFLLLTIGAIQHGVPTFPLRAWIVVICLAVFNTAVAYTLWNDVLQVLTAAEAGVILSTIMIQVAVFDWLVFGRILVPREIVGLGIAAAGAVIVEVWQS